MDAADLELIGIALLRAAAIVLVLLVAAASAGLAVRIFDAMAGR